MGQKIQLDDREYDIENMTERAKAAVKDIQFINFRLQHLENMKAILTRAKISYIETIKQEIISNKAGIILDDE